MMHWISLMPKAKPHKSNERYLSIIDSTRSHIQNTAVSARPINKKYFLGAGYPGVYFTRRETQVAFYLSQRNTMKKIATVLGVAFSTVEHFVRNMRAKLNCKSRHELMEAIIKSNILNNDINDVFEKTTRRGVL